MFSTLYLYLYGLLAYWWAYMMAGPFIIDEAIRWLKPTWNVKLSKRLRVRRRRRAEIALMLLGVFLAGFLAFKDEHDARTQAEKTVSELRQKVTEKRDRTEVVPLPEAAG